MLQEEFSQRHFFLADGPPAAFQTHLHLSTHLINLITLSSQPKFAAGSRGPETQAVGGGRMLNRKTVNRTPGPRTRQKCLSASHGIYYLPMMVDLCESQSQVRATGHFHESRNREPTIGPYWPDPDILSPRASAAAAHAD